MPAADRPEGDARQAEDDGPSLPELLAQAAGLGAALEAQQAALTADLRDRLAGIPGLPQPDPLPAPPDGMPDLPGMIERLQEQMAAAGDALAALAGGFGIAAPAGAGSEELLAALGALAASAADQHLAVLGSAALPEPAAAAGALPDFPDLIKRLQDGQAAAQQQLDGLLAARGLDPADPLAGLSRLVPPPPASPAAPPSGFPGAERMASLQDGAQRLGALTAELMAKIVPR